MGLRPTGDVESNELARDLDAITALREENLAAINASDVSTLLTTFTDDVVFLPDDQPPVVGKAAFEAWAMVKAELKTSVFSAGKYNFVGISNLITCLIFVG